MKGVLRLWEEYEGTLKNFRLNNDFNQIFLIFIPNEVIAISYSTSLENILKKLIGKKICILHTDVKGKEYIIMSEEKIIDPK